MLLQFVFHTDIHIEWQKLNVSIMYPSLLWLLPTRSSYPHDSSGEKEPRKNYAPTGGKVFWGRAAEPINRCFLISFPILRQS